MPANDEPDVRARMRVWLAAKKVTNAVACSGALTLYI